LTVEPFTGPLLPSRFISLSRALMIRSGVSSDSHSRPSPDCHWRSRDTCTAPAFFCGPSSAG
jgi:hypothetical protein